MVLVENPGNFTTGANVGPKPLTCSAIGQNTIGQFDNRYGQIMRNRNVNHIFMKK